MTVQEILVILQHSSGGEVLAFEADCEEYCECEVAEVQLHGGWVYLHLGARRDELLRR